MAIKITVFYIIKYSKMAGPDFGKSKTIQSVLLKFVPEI